MSDELKRCPVPWCNGEADIMTPEDFGDNRGTVMCMSCYLTTPDTTPDTWQEAVKVWNTRHSGWLDIAGIPDELKDGRWLYVWWDGRKSMAMYYKGWTCWGSPSLTDKHRSATPSHYMDPRPPEEVG